MSFTSPTGALARRELRGAFSRYRLIVFLVLWTGAAVALNYIYLPIATRNFAELSGQARELLTIESMALLLGLCLAVPSIAAVSVTAERDQETLDQLRLTLLTDRAILRGKAIASLAAAVGFIIAMMPVFAVAQFSVGLDNAQILEALLYVLAFTHMIVNVGLACSAIFRRALPALVVTYLALSVLALAPVFFELDGSQFVITSGSTGNVSVFIAGGQAVPLEQQLVAYLSPSAVVRTILRGAVAEWEIALICLMPLLLSMVAARAARWGLARTSEPKAVRQSKLIGDEQVLLARRKTFPYYLIDPLKPRPPIPDGKNALLMREFRWGLFQRATWMVRGTYGVFFASFLAFAFGALNYTPSSVVSAFLLVIGMLALAIPATFGNAFTKERELGNFDMLRMTLLDAREIIVGKAVGGAAVLGPALGAVVVAGAIANIFRPEQYFLVFCGFVTMATSALIMLSVSLFASLVARRTSTAVAMGAGLSLYALLGVLPTLYLLWAVLAFIIAPVQLPAAEVNDSLPWWTTSRVSPVYSLVECFASEGIYAQWQYHVPENIGRWVVSQIIGIAAAGAMLLLSGYILVRYRMRDG